MKLYHSACASPADPAYLTVCRAGLTYGLDLASWDRGVSELHAVYGTYAGPTLCAGSGAGPDQAVLKPAHRTDLGGYSIQCPQHWVQPVCCMRRVPASFQGLQAPPTAQGASIGHALCAASPLTDPAPWLQHADSLGPNPHWFGSQHTGLLQQDTACSPLIVPAS